jgi:tRNA nucleotidyltransferase (CCA-adding enzyme)
MSEQTRELCCLCRQETGRAGKADDSIYIYLSDAEIGPLCEECQDGIIEWAKEYDYNAVAKQVEAETNKFIADLQAAQEATRNHTSAVFGPGSATDQRIRELEERVATLTRQCGELVEALKNLTDYNTTTYYSKAMCALAKIKKEMGDE